MPTAPPALIYLDTSVLMALLCPEPESSLVEAWYEAAAMTLVSTPWIKTELSSAVALKVRTKQMKATAAASAIAAGRMLLLTTRSEAIKSEDFESAADLCADAARSLRGPDALHLSAAKRLGCTHMATLDELMAQGASHLGIQPIDFQLRA